MGRKPLYAIVVIVFVLTLYLVWGGWGNWVTYPMSVVPGDVQLGATKISGSVTLQSGGASGYPSTYGGGCLIYADANSQSCTKLDLGPNQPGTTNECGAGGYCTTYTEDDPNAAGAQKVCWHQPTPDASCWKSCPDPKTMRPLEINVPEQFNAITIPPASGPVRWRVVSRQNEANSCALHSLNYGHIKRIP